MEENIEETSGLVEITGGLSTLNRLKEYFKRIFKSLSHEVVILIDGPNMLRKIDGKRLSLKDVIRKAKNYGRIRAAKAIVTSDAPTSLIKALQTSGFEVILTQENITYVTLAIEAARMIYECSPDFFVIVSRDSRCLPIVHKIKEKGIKAIIAGYEQGFSTALKNASDEVIYLELTEAEE
ncbi:MAG: NYN domain-containing protein [Crenarchaeota archaeon]|nr:NYN domain-containing protein [Thermoproteota archaeon]MCR8454900.1 NYN domain-containing protein [Thermoproteota archaeon]MCR8462786.1 NYN domain-containing protein [Thermoproteota archaeon]MCR8470519.1 NYN domain-containing protein [Thermoproteota archaeon]MCR8471514.1 NYN domain-containing protein [Thermoproteota archaeon]